MGSKLVATVRESDESDAYVQVFRDENGCYFNYYATRSGASDGHKTKHGKSYKAACRAAAAWVGNGAVLTNASPF